METTLQPVSQGIRHRIATIEAIELAIIGFVLWCIGALLSIGAPDVTFVSLLALLVLIEGGLLGSWLIYNLYIRLARAGGRAVDVGLWIVASLATATYTFWAWTILDINRWLVKKFLYRGEAPVEFAWSVRSKQIRKVWEQAHKNIP